MATFVNDSNDCTTGCAVLHNAGDYPQSEEFKDLNDEEITRNPETCSCNLNTERAQVKVQQKPTSGAAVCFSDGEEVKQSGSKPSDARMENNIAEVVDEYLEEASSPHHYHHQHQTIIGGEIKEGEPVNLDCKALAERLPVTMQGPCSSTLFENGYFMITHSNTAGLGAMAKKDLKQGDVILKERPLFVANHASVFEEFARLGRDKKDIALSLHANALFKLGTPKIHAIWKTNCFAVTDTEAGLFPIASRFNHACHPSQTIDFAFDEEEGCLVLSVRVEHILAGAELKISYGANRTPMDLFRRYGFQCRCGMCSGLSDDHALLQTQQW